MAERPKVYTIPPERAFADALAKGLLADAGSELALARTTVMLPNRRAARALTEAFVRLSGGGLLLPRMLAIGDVDEDEAVGTFDGALELEAALPPAVPSFERRMLLMSLVARWRKASGRTGAAVETLRLADALARTLDQLQLEGVDPSRLEEEGEFSEHWRLTLDFLKLIVAEWPKLLKRRGDMDRVARRQALIRRVAEKWRGSPPDRPIVAAGMNSADAEVAALLRVISCLPKGAVVLPGVDIEIAESYGGKIASSHPQATTSLLLERMGVAAGEVREWPWASERDGDPDRSRAIAEALALPERTATWNACPPLEGLKAVEAGNPAEEAAVIALAMRRCLEEKGKSAALVTPDRALARRVAAQLRRWDVEVDDSAGTPLARTPPGTFLTAALECGARGFAPTALLALLKHPLAGPAGETERLRWLDEVRRLDLALRGVRPARGLAGIRRRIAALREMEMRPEEKERLKAWWAATAKRLEPLEALMKAPATLDVTADALRAFAEGLSNDGLWRGPAGRAAGELIAELIAHGGSGEPIPPADLPALFAAMTADVAVRPPFGRHPRLSIYGLLEARLQRADLMILGGLNEGVWPAASAFDPWLPPAIRRRIDLPETERAIGLAAHDFVSAAGAREVLLTRARRDASAPAVASRFWLRLEAYAGHLERDEELVQAARAIDRRPQTAFAPRPAPIPPRGARPIKISVTQVDRLRADPFSFYAQQILSLEPLDPLDADPSAADKGTLVHGMLETLVEKGGLFDPARREAVADEALAQFADQPLLGALWRPRVLRMLEWVADTLAARRGEGWTTDYAERKGTLHVGDVRLTGKADIVQRGAGGLAIADYKTGRLPSGRQIGAGFALQLGLLAWLAEEGVLEGVDPARATELAYWKLSGGEKTPGEMKSTAKNFAEAWGDVPEFVAMCRRVFAEVAGDYLTGTRPFTAKLHPDYAASMKDYDHLARVAEWRGREGA
jgi:ATP-dependent helicase/nuclease subunit B